MTNTVNTNNQNLRLSALSVGLRSTLRLAFPNIPTEATRVEIIVTNEIAVSYAAEWNAGTAVWECDIPASQFMKVGKQKYEVAYLLDGEQFWDGQGWIEIVKATTKGILPNPETNTTRYYITSINGIYGATETDGNVRIPALYTGAALPPVAEHIENDQFFNTVNNSLYVLANGDWKSVAGSGGDGGVAELMIETTHADLVTLRDNGALIPGMQYRITDYVATTVQEHTQSANHPFDIIVTADSADRLNEAARAFRHNGDTYFPATTKFEAWQIWYSLDNDTKHFAWADKESGKGVIYRMIDEWNNDVPYDFKGIKMQAYLGYDEGTGDMFSEDHRYTFGGSSDETIVAYSGCYSNKMGVYFVIPNKKRKLNQNIFGYSCRSNTFGDDCYYNTLGGNFYNNTFGNNCYANTFRGLCGGNTLGNKCYDNTFGSGCYYNTLGSGCYDNTLGSDCYGNTLGSGCSNNTFGSGCYYNTLGSDCYYNTLYDFFSEIILQNSVAENTIDCTADRGEYEYCKNIEIKSGVIGKGIDIDDVEQSYHTEIRPEDSITITV